jgi:hypothetical protein
VAQVPLGVVQYRPNGTASHAATYQATPTPDGHDQVTEPCVLHFTDGKYGHTYWCCLAPYYNSDDTLENACLLVSDDDPPTQTWTAPAGITNPIVAKPAGGHNEDQSLFLHPDGSLGVVWMDVISGTQTIRYLLYDGVTLGSATALRSQTITTSRFVAPIIAYESGTWHMWATETVGSWPVGFYHFTASTLDGLGTATATVCTVSEPPDSKGRWLWESNVIRYNGQWIACITTSQGKSGTATWLHLMASPNGDDWLLNPTPILKPAASGWDDGLVYRGSLVDRGNAALDLWYSGDGTDGWHMGYTTVTLS